jgi:predicted LPLAT superfamily acyltransferase
MPGAMTEASKLQGSVRGYRAIGVVYRLLGHGFVAFLARFIAFYYFLFHPGVVAASMRFFGAVFPEAGHLGRWWWAWRQFRSFTTVFVDRLLLENGEHDRLRLAHEGLEFLTAAAAAGRPAILWMSHLGNWEVAVHCLSRCEVPVTLAIGRRAAEQVSRFQKEALARAGIEVVFIEEGEDLAAVELIHALRAGGIVAISGDRLFHASQRHVEVGFLGRTCRVPRGPYVLAGLTGAPLTQIFGLRAGRLAYRFVALPPRHVDLSERSRREERIAEAAAGCFAALETMVRSAPDQWYNFYDYWK